VLYELMNKGKVVATVEERYGFGQYTYSMVEQHDAYLPYGFVSMDERIDDRQVARHRAPIRRLMFEAGIDNHHAFIERVSCVSLTDTFWMRRAGSGVSWKAVSPYTNDFDSTVARMAFDGEGTCDHALSAVSPEFATAGSFDKCWVREDGVPLLVKRGSSGAVNAGFEPYSEKLRSDILAAAGLAHVPYALCTHQGQLASKCPLFTSEKLGFVPAARLLRRGFSVSDILSLVSDHGVEEPFREMLVVDALCANVDRHPGNYGFMVDNDTGEICGLAPAFDQNLALLPHLKEADDMDEYLLLQRPKIGGDFVEVARALLTPRIRDRLMAIKDFEYQDPGFAYPAWKLDVVNRLLRRQIDAILA